MAQNQYGNQGGNWAPPPNQQQYGNNPQYNQNQYGNQGGGNFNPQQQQQYPPQQQQNNPNQGGGNWNAPPNNWNPNQQNNYNQQNQGGNWQQPPTEQQRLHQGPKSDQTWQNDPQVTVKKKGNTTITETTQSGGGKGKSFEYGGPPQFGPGRVKESGPHQPQNKQEEIDYFRLKLWEESCCCCGGLDHPCLNMWIWSIFWLIIFLFNGVVNLIGYLARLTAETGGKGYTAIAMIITIASICINCFALYGLIRLIPIAFAIQLLFFIILFLLVVVGVFIYPFTGGYMFMSLLFIVCDVWAFWVIWKVYGWAKHFKNGGRYDPDMHRPQ